MSFFSQQLAMYEICVLPEALVGAVHFEGRLCEELLRLSSDGILRCFTPYDCEKPRVSVHVSEIQQVDSVPGLFLGRFLLWQARWCSHVKDDFSGLYSQADIHKRS